MYRVLIACLVLQLAVVPNVWAQFGAGGGRPMARPGARKPSKPRVAEAAKKKPKGPKPIKAKGWGSRKPMQFFEADGYLRFRGDMFHRPHLNLSKILDGPEPPWPNNPGGQENTIDFVSIAEIMETHPDDLSRRFAKSLREWAIVEAGEGSV